MQGKIRCWTEEQDRMVIEGYKKKGPKQLSQEMGISENCLYARASRLGVFESREASEVDDRLYDLSTFQQRIGAIKEKAKAGVINGQRVVALYKDKVVLEVEANDKRTYKECFTFQELALAK